MIEMHDVQKRYPGFTLDFDLRLKKGEVAALIGRNGSGKTTAFKLILHLIPADAGTIQVFEESTDRLPVKMKEKIGAVLSDSFFPSSLKVRELIPVLTALYPSFQKEWFAQQLQAFSLDPDKRIQDLSTGMNARLKVLCALSHQPDLLILDEPTAGLDVIARGEILDLLRQFMENEDHGILISSHISSDLENLCDQFYLIDEGKLLLHADGNDLDENYGVLKVGPDAFALLDRQGIKAFLKRPYGYEVLVDQRNFYQENYPDLPVEKAALDQILEILVKGERT